MPESNALSSEQAENYVQQGGVRCPYCGSGDIEGSRVEIDAGTAWQEVSCSHCESRWQDVYELVSITPLS